NEDADGRSRAQRARRFAFVLRPFGAEHDHPVAPMDFRMSRLAVRPRHGELLLEAKGLLVKGQGGIGVFHRQKRSHPWHLGRLGRSLTHRCCSWKKEKGHRVSIPQWQYTP